MTNNAPRIETGTIITINRLLDRLISLSSFRFFPQGYLKNEEGQDINALELMADGKKKRISKPLKWIEERIGKKAGKENRIKVVIYNSVALLSVGIRLSFNFQRVKKTDQIKLLSPLLITPYTLETGMKDNETVEADLNTDNNTLYRICHNLSTIKEIFG